jgi:hypothetical protein
MSAGKGSAARNCFSRQYRENWDQIFPPSSRGAEEVGKAIRCTKGTGEKVRPSAQSVRTVPPHP